jgi:hypothetical protein
MGIESTRGHNDDAPLSTFWSFVEGDQRSNEIFLWIVRAIRDVGESSPDEGVVMRLGTAFAVTALGATVAACGGGNSSDELQEASTTSEAGVVAESGSSGGPDSSVLGSDGGSSLDASSSGLDGASFGDSSSSASDAGSTDATGPVEGSSGDLGDSGAGKADSSGETDGGTGPEPCDLFQAGDTPCVAAFSTVRALFRSYNGNLYQVMRADNTTQDIGVQSPGGVANAAAQDTFCSGTSCTISIIYDQSGQGNHLTRAPKGSNNHGAQDSLAVANALPITIGGHKAYGVHSPPGTGYRNDATKGVATGDNPETIYEVADGTYNPQGCCFDFGNAETQPVAGGDGFMEALLFGKAYWDTGSGNGPWVLADMEVGVYNHGGATGTGRVSNYPNEPSMPYPFVTAMIKGNSANASSGGPFTVKGAKRSIRRPVDVV